MLDVVVNPATGSGRGRKIYEELKPVFDEGGEPYRVHFSEPDKPIEEIVRDITREGSAKLVLIGGDGSMNEAVNGIADFAGTRLCFIPAGSGNDLARALGEKGRRQKILRHLTGEGKERLMDIGVLESGGKRRLFNISSGIGFDADTCYHADRSRMKKALNRIRAGKLIYITTALGLILKNDSFSCRIRTEDGTERVYEKCLFAVGMNHCYEGGGFMFCPEASDEDGMLDFCVADGIGAGKFLRMFPSALSGRHVYYPEIDIFRAREAVICTGSQRHIHADGEAGIMADELKLSIHPEKLRLLV